MIQLLCSGPRYGSVKFIFSRGKMCESEQSLYCTQQLMGAALDSKRPVLLVNSYLTAYIMQWHKEASRLIGKKPICYGIKKYLALKYSPLILKLQVTFTKRQSYKPTFKVHRIIMYLNHASTVVNTQNQCQIWIYLKNTCCVQLNIVLQDRVNLNCTETLKANT